MDAVRLQLVADEWSFDPDGNELGYQWLCQPDCAALLTSLSSSVTEVVMSGLNSSESDVMETRVFEISVQVQDATGPARHACVSTIQIGDSDSTASRSMIASFSSPSTSISNAVRLRLLGALQYIDGAGL